MQVIEIIHHHGSWGLIHPSITGLLMTWQRKQSAEASVAMDLLACNAFRITRTLWGEFTGHRHSQVDSSCRRPVMQRSDIHLILAQDKLANKQSGCWFKTPRRSCDVTVMDRDLPEYFGISAPEVCVSNHSVCDRIERIIRYIRQLFFVSCWVWNRPIYFANQGT